MSDPERIWLQNADDASATGDRLWCQDKVWPECAEQQEPTEYIRADRISQQDAELERVRRELEETEALRAEGAAKNADMTLRLAEARKAAFIEAAEMVEAHMGNKLGRSYAAALRDKAEEAGR